MPMQHYTPPGEERPGIVVVAGEETVAYLSRRLEGYRLQPAADMVAARKLVREQHPEAVIVNVAPEPEEATQAAGAEIMPEPVPLIQCALPGSPWHHDPGPFDDWLVKPIGAARLEQVLAQHPAARRVLVVDDDRSFVRLVRRILEAQDGGHQVLWAHSGAEALAKLKREGADLVLVDIGLPDLNGRTVARLMRECPAGKSSVLVAVTALQPGSDVAAAVPRSFAVTSYAGIGEESALALIRSCLAHLRPQYALSEPASVPEADWRDPMAS
ncbi:MAG: response regulator [Anaerolineae bacterium]